MTNEVEEHNHEDICNDCKAIQTYLHECSHDTERRLDAMRAMGCAGETIAVEQKIDWLIEQCFDDGFEEGMAAASEVEDTSKNE